MLDKVGGVVCGKEAVNSEEQQQQRVEEEEEEEEEEGVIHRARARRCMLGQVGARWEYGNPFLIGFAGNL